MNMVRLCVAGALAVGMLTGAGAVSATPSGQVSAKLDSGVFVAGDSVRLEKAQWMWGGRNYCWYPGGWHGPGYYWCGYAYRRGFGWGGPAGWNGWNYDRMHDRGWHRGWRNREWRDRNGDYRGDRRGDYPR